MLFNGFSMILNVFVHSVDRFADRFADRSDDLYGFALLFNGILLIPTVSYNQLTDLLTDLLTGLLTYLLTYLLADLMMYMGLQCFFNGVL